MQAIERIKDGWKQFRTCSSDDFAALIAHIDRLEAENERLRKDAERMPMTLDEIKQNPVIRYFGVESGEKIVRAVEAFHNIKGTP